MKHTDTIALQGSIADMRQRIAAEQAAMHKVRLGVARWRNTPAPQDADAPPSPASQTHWHAEAQCQFMCWLELGGFAHADAAADNVSAPPWPIRRPTAAPTPATTQQRRRPGKQALCPRTVTAAPPERATIGPAMPCPRMPVLPARPDHALHDASPPGTDDAQKGTAALRRRSQAPSGLQ